MQSTTNICDSRGDSVLAAQPIFRDFGGVRVFNGPMSTVRVFEDNVLVRAALSEPGAGRVLVVDGGGSLRCALLGDQVAALAVANGWTGVIVNGCVRDVAELAGMPLGIKALAAHPVRSIKRGAGERDIPVCFAGATFHPGLHLWADQDGIVAEILPGVPALTSG
jgi:regulator of ribonuclease activity A